MRSMFPVFMFVVSGVFALTSDDAFAVTSTPVPAKQPVPASSSTHTQWFRDADSDGYAAPDVVAVGPVAPKGTKAADAFRGTNDPIDTNYAVFPGAVEESATDGIDQNGSGAEIAGSKEETARSLASWTLHANIKNGPNLAAYPKVYGQVLDALNKDFEWNVLRGQPDLAAGWAWRSVQNEDGSWGGEAYVIHGGASGNGGSGGVDSRARKDVAALGTRLGAVENTVTSQGTRLGAVENTVTSQGTRLGAVENTVASQGTRLTTAEATVNGLADDVWGVGGTKAEPTDGLVTEFADHTDNHVVVILGAGYAHDGQSMIKDSGLLVRGDSANGFEVNTVIGGRFLNYGLAGLLVDGTMVKEEAEVSGERISATGYDLGGSAVLGGTIPVKIFDITVAATGGLNASWSGAMGGQSQASAYGPAAGLGVWGWYDHVGINFRYERFWESTGHSVVFEDSEEAVHAMDLVPITGETTANVFRIGVATWF